LLPPSAGGLDRVPFRKLPLPDVVVIGLHGIGDEVVQRRVETGRHLAFAGAELRGNGAFEAGLPRPDHDRGASLPGIAIGSQPVRAAGRREDAHRPEVGQGRLQLDLRLGILGCSDIQPGPKPVPRRAGRGPFPRGRIPGDLPFEPGEGFADLSVARHVIAPWPHRPDGLVWPSLSPAPKAGTLGQA